MATRRRAHNRQASRSTLGPPDASMGIVMGVQGEPALPRKASSCRVHSAAGCPLLQLSAHRACQPTGAAGGARRPAPGQAGGGGIKSRKRSEGGEMKSR